MQLTVSHLGCRRGGKTIFSDVSFSLAAGEALCLTGRNGAGKSSLLRVLAGLLPATGGSVRLEPEDATHTERQRIHYLGHDDALKPALTVLENLSFWLSWLHGDISALAALDMMELQSLAHFPARSLSAGQKRRLAFARILAARRPLWLLDEPMTALDEAAQRTCHHHIEAHLASGGMAVIATHHPIGISPVRSLHLEPHGGNPFSVSGQTQ